MGELNMPMPRRPGFFYRLFNDLYEVTIYREDDKPRKFWMKSVSRLNSKHFKGIDEDGQKVEYKTTEDFDFFKRKLY